MSRYAGFLRLNLPNCYRYRLTQLRSSLFDQFVNIAKLKCTHFTDFNTSRYPALMLTVHTIVAFYSNSSFWLCLCRWEIGDNVEGAGHCAHPAEDTLIAIDEDNIHIIVAANSSGRTDHLAGGRVTMATLTGERCIQAETGSGDNKTSWCGAFRKCGDKVFTLRVLYHTSEFALVTANTSLRVNENNLHPHPLNQKT